MIFILYYYILGFTYGLLFGFIWGIISEFPTIIWPNNITYNYLKIFN